MWRGGGAVPLPLVNLARRFYLYPDPPLPPPSYYAICYTGSSQSVWSYEFARIAHCAWLSKCVIGQIKETNPY